MRIILSSAGPRSEVLPLLALGGELTRRGHYVTLCVPERYRSKMMVLEHRMVTCGASFDEYLEGPMTGSREFPRALAAQVPSQFVAMRDSLREADILIGGGFMLAAASQAELQKIPYFQLVQTPLLLDRNRFPVAGTAAKKGLFESREKRRKEWEDILLPAINAERRHSHMNPLADLHKYLYASGHILVAADASIISMSGGATETVTGFWHFDDGDFSSEELKPLLASEGATVLIEPLGVPAEETAPFVQALCAELSAARIRAVFHAAWSGLDGVQLPAGCHVLPAFPNERFSAVLHCGTAQMFAAAATAGVPQVVAPVLLEHAYWAERVSALGIGPAPVPNNGAARVAAAVKEAVGNASFRQRSRELGEKLKAQNGPAVAAETIEKFGAETGHGG